MSKSFYCNTELLGFSEFAPSDAVIGSNGEFNRFCQKICDSWKRAYPRSLGVTTGRFERLLRTLERSPEDEKVIPTSWGGVVVDRYRHPQVEKFLVVREGRYLALEKHDQKDEYLEVLEGAGVIVWRRSSTSELLAEKLLAGTRVHLSPGVEHCIIGTEDLLLYERSRDPKGMDRDLIFLYTPEEAELESAFQQQAYQ
ncbi:MAG: hypothetical protein KDD64_09360 [Bdellovibrionales bacterium]|nr:hypothetical protein [Bdellovibrionales bacterium]